MSIYTTTTSSSSHNLFPWREMEEHTDSDEQSIRVVSIGYDITMNKKVRSEVEKHRGRLLRRESAVVLVLGFGIGMAVDGRSQWEEAKEEEINWERHKKGGTLSERSMFLFNEGHEKTSIRFWHCNEYRLFR